MVDPCATTTLDAFTVSDMWTEVLGAPDVLVLSDNPPTDSVAKLFGDLTGTTWCGTKTLTIQSISPANPIESEFLSLDENWLIDYEEETVTFIDQTLTASTNYPAHEGTYTVTLHIALDDYPSIETTTVFDVVIGPCQLIGSSLIA